MQPRIPPEARPYEVGILIAYHILGMKNAEDIRKLFHYKTRKPIYTTLKKYRDVDISSSDENSRPLITLFPGS